MPKRNATSELNHDNWNVEDTPEEAGTFQKATPDIIEKRVIRSARRRGVGSAGFGGASSVFAEFQGFSKTPENSSLFSFLKKSNSTQEGAGQQSKVESSHIPMFKAPVKDIPIGEQDPLQPSPPYTTSYLGAIKKLNECFLKHIQSCFDENQFIILSPCFRDYEQHLKSILPLNDSNDKGEGENKTTDEKVETPLSQKRGHDGESSPNVSSGKKTNFLDNVEASGGSGFKIFGGDGNTSLPNSSATTPGSSSPFSAPAKKQFSWLGGWGSTTSPTNQETASKQASESQKGEPKSAGEEATDESDAPPKVEFKQVVEKGAVYSRRCKVYVKKDDNFHDHGVGMLYVKPVETGNKTQLIVRADTSLGNLLINTLLSTDLTIQKMGKNNVMLICIPTPDFKPCKPHPILLRVKTSDEADELLQKLNEFKK